MCAAAAAAAQGGEQQQGACPAVLYGVRPACCLGEVSLESLAMNMCNLAPAPAAAAAAANITGSIPPELGSMTALQELDLSTNYLTGTIPPQLGNLRNLQSLK